MPAPLQLPALRCLGNLADLSPMVVIDTREQTPLPFARLATVQDTLQTGDYSFRGGERIFAVERKSIADLVGCCAGDNRDRFFRELHRLRGFRFKRLLVVGERSQIEAGDFRGHTRPAAILATLGTLEARFDVPVVFDPSPESAARRIESWAYYVAREVVQDANTMARANGLTKRQGTAQNNDPA